MLPTEPDQTKTFLYNPSKNDFLWPYDGVDQTLPSRKIVSFPKYLADHLAKHLAQKLALEDGGSGSQYEFDYKKWIKQIYVEI
jgi:hypothetical protein